MMFTEQELLNDVMVEEFLPNIYSAKVAVEVLLPNGERLVVVGSGIGNDVAVAREKSFSELYERLSFSCGRLFYEGKKFACILYPKSKFKVLDWKDIYKPLEKYTAKTSGGNYSSTGISCHTDVYNAVDHAILEIFERDQISLCWRLKDWPVEDLTHHYCDYNVVKFLKEKKFDCYLWNCSSINGIYVLICCLVSDSNKLAIGSAAGKCRDTVMLKSLTEAYILQESLEVLEQSGESLYGSKKRILDASDKGEEILKYFFDKSLKNHRSFRVEPLSLMSFFCAVYCLDMDPCNYIVPSNLKVIRVFSDYNFNTSDTLQEWHTKISNFPKHRLFPEIDLSKINTKTFPFG